MRKKRHSVVPQLTAAIKATLIVLVVFNVLLLMTCVGRVEANDVKYCKDARTGKIIVVPANTPCPYPTHEI